MLWELLWQCSQPVMKWIKCANNTLFPTSLEVNKISFILNFEVNILLDTINTFKIDNTINYLDNICKLKIVRGRDFDNFVYIDSIFNFKKCQKIYFFKQR